MPDQSSFSVPVLGEEHKEDTLTYSHETDKDNNIYYRVLKTTYFEAGDPESVTGLNTEALNALFPVDMMDSCEEMMIQDWHGAPIKRMILRTSASHTTQRLPMFWSTLRAKCLMPI